MAPCEQRLLDLLGEETLAADLRQRPIADDVAGGADDLERDAGGVEAMGGGEERLHQPRLRQRERTAAGADAQNRGGGLHPMTSQW